MPHGQKNLKHVLFQQLVVALIWGGTWTAGRIATQEAPALAVGGWRFILATLALGVFVWRAEGRFPKLSKMDRWSVILLGAIGVYGYSLCFFYGLKHIQAGRGALVVALNPIVVALAAWLVMGESLSPKKILGILIGLVGCLTVLGRGNPIAIFQGGLGLGEVLVLGCVVAWTAYTLLSRRISRTLSPLVMTFYASLVGTVLLVMTGIAEGSLRVWPHYSFKAWLSIMYLGFLGSSVAYVWYANGVKALGATRAAAFINLVPISAVVLSACILNERVSMMTLLGGALVLIGVTLTNHTRQPKLIP